ncbi:MAG: hypothetical protein DRG83_08515 [Deltaproteobacteria bacterium]|nr:MAG: hypothetical protein DRG83_08515 [Deltaproteobacteria bacterium]
MNIIGELRKKKKRTFIEKSAINVVIAIIEAYQLNSNFLSLLDNLPDLEQKIVNHEIRLRPKPYLNIPIFPLTSRNNFRLAQKIVEKIDNPYLKYARDPEEIYLSKLLFWKNPDIRAIELENIHFELLLNSKKKGTRCIIQCPSKAGKE